MKKYLKQIFGGMVLSLLFGTATLAAPVAPKYLNITTGNPQVMKNDKFFVSINVSNAKTIKKTEIKLDGEVVKTCGAVYTCSTDIGTFTDDQIGEHVYSFLITGKNGATSEPWGKFQVMDGDKNNFGAWFSKIRVYTASYQPEIGKKYNLLVYTADKKMIYNMSLAVNDEELMDMYAENLGSKTYSSGRLLPAFKKTDLGEHEFSFNIKAPNGDIIESSGSFFVVGKGEILPPPSL